jgi:carboxyl-terminal processing protease
MQDIASEVETIVRRMERRSPSDVWGDERRLEALGDPAVPAIRKALETAGPTARLGCASALLALGQTDDAVDALVALVGTSEDRDLRIHAIKVLGGIDPGTGLETGKRVADALLEHLDDTFHPIEKVTLLKTLWRLSPENRVRAKTLLKETLESDNPEYRLESALALAEIGDPYSARSVLLEFLEDPTVKGDLARSLFTQLEYQQRIEMLDRKIRDLESGGSPREADRSDADRFLAELEARLADRYAQRGELNALFVQKLMERVVDHMEDHEFVEEILDKVSRYYIRRNDLTREEMMDAAARGILDALDDHSAYFTGEEIERWSFDLNPDYAGIGAYVNNVDGRFTIIRPIYSGPAYDVGLRSGDWIMEVDGWPTADKTVEEITRRLKGLPGTKVKVKISRKLWKEPKEFEIVRDNIEIRTVKSRLLPGGIGYVEISNFASETSEELEDELRKLESEGLRALVLDLRDNSGGYLTTARQVVDKFLPAGKLIVECKGADDEPVRDSRGRWSYFTTGSFPHPEVPMVVLINRASASASEIVAGCLQEHGRAVIVGERSYGKGSVQNLFPIESRPGESFTDVPRENGHWDEGEAFEDRDGNGRYDLGEPFSDAPRRNGRWDAGELFEDADGNEQWDPGEPYTDSNGNRRYDPPEDFVDRDGNGKCDQGPHMKVTIARYFLPNGRSIHREVDRDGKVLHEGGVIPDIEQEVPDVPLWILEEGEKIIESKALEQYVEDRIGEHRDDFILLAEFDGFDPSRYPDFEELYEGLDTRVPREDIRRWLRRFYVRRKVQDILGREFIEDVQEDVQLQRAIARLADEIEVDLASIPWYRHFADKFAEAGTEEPKTRVAEERER